MNWIELNDKGQLSQLLEASHNHVIAIFKHSTSCGISRMVLKNFERETDALGEDPNIQYYFLDLLKYRPVSNAVAELYEVIHESPQLIVLKNGAVVHHASHNDISASIFSN